MWPVVFSVPRFAWDSFFEFLPSSGVFKHFPGLLTITSVWNNWICLFKGKGPHKVFDFDALLADLASKCMVSVQSCGLDVLVMQRAACRMPFEVSLDLLLWTYMLFELNQGKNYILSNPIASVRALPVRYEDIALIMVIDLLSRLSRYTWRRRSRSWPFFLYLQTGWAAIFIELVLCYLLIGTENIGIQIEEPFCIMPLMEFCKGMEKSIVDIMECYLSIAQTPLTYTKSDVFIHMHASHFMGLWVE